MRAFSVFIYFCLNFIARSNAQGILGVGFCPKVNGMTGFNFTKVEGIWYEAENYWSLVEVPLSCGKVNYTDRLDGSAYEDLTFHEKITGRYWRVPTIYRRTLHDGEYKGKILITLSPLPFPVWFRLKFVDTDYNTYIIKYYCQQLGFLNVQILWIMAKDRSYPESVKNAAHVKLAFLGIDMSRLVRSDQTSCLD